MRSLLALALASLSLIGLGVVSVAERAPGKAAAELQIPAQDVPNVLVTERKPPVPEAERGEALLREALADALREEAWDETIDPGVPIPWQLADGPPIELRIGNESIAAAAAHLDTAILAAAEIGEPLALMLPDVGPVEVVVQRIADVSPGTTVIQGQLAGSEETHPVVLTWADTYTFVNVATPEGVYVGEFQDGSGWLHFDDLEDRLVDHSTPDVLIPEEETS